MKKLMMAMVAFAAAMPMVADEETVGGYTWTYRINEEDDAEIFGIFYEAAREIVPGVSPKPTGDVTLPSRLGDCAVDVIGEYAFYGCDEMTSLTISDWGVSSIGDSAFCKCGSLESINLPDRLMAIGNNAFMDCHSLSSIVIPGDVSFIGNYAFYRCLDLTDLRFQDGVEEIGACAFSDCTSLMSVTIPFSVTTIGDKAFSGCTSLTSARLPRRFEGKLRAKVFEDCPVTITYYDTDYSWHYDIDDGKATIVNLEDPGFSPAISPRPVGDLVIPSSFEGKPVTEIGNDAFYWCRQLTGVTMPAAVTKLGLRAFAGCTRLTDAAIPAGVRELDDSVFENCASLTNAVIPDGVTSLAFYLFKGCSSLKEIEIPDSVTSIGVEAFAGSGLTSVTIPGSVRLINDEAFARCTNLTSVTVANGVMEISWGAFRGCSSLMSVSLPKRFEGTLDESVFEGCPKSMKITYCDPPYVINFHRYDGTDTSAQYEFGYGEPTKLPTLAKLGWARRGFTFKGWATSQANADAGKVWKTDGAIVSTAIASGKTLNVWAVWALKSDCYAIKFIRNDGAGTWRTIGFKYGEKTRLPSLQNGLKWARRGFTFKGWALTTADAAAEKVWKADWSYVATAAEKGKTLTVYAVWELKPGFYQIRFNKNDGTTKWRSIGFAVDVSTKLSTIKGLGWGRAGYTFKGWATSKANADAGKVWKTDGATVKNAAPEGKTLSIYAIWQ